MTSAFENKLQIGKGIYTMPDISHILQIPAYKVNRWVREYFDKKLADNFSGEYSWTINDTRAVSFHTLVELYIFIELNDQGVSTKDALKAHRILSERLNTPFPFANKEVLEGLNTDSKKVFFNTEDQVIISLDGKFQLSFDFIRLFFKKLDFGSNMLANRLWPLGKDKSIVCDPERQFGSPVIAPTNIYPETLYNMHKAGEPLSFIADIYEISTRQVEDAIAYCKAA
jgi:uncharacterized protein (DUF433 family)